MNYKDYISFGFDRKDMIDSVEFEKLGYYGYCLTKKLSESVSIEVYSFELDKPKLYIKKRNSDTYHIIQIPCDAIPGLFFIPKDFTNFSNLA
jgi:hypothetical protein